MPFNYQIMTDSGSGPSLSYSSSLLPDGLVLDDYNGYIYGIPLITGSHTTIIEAGNPFGTGTAALQVIINEGPIPVITSDTVVTGTYGMPLYYQITTAESGSAMYYNTYSSSPLPNGLSLDDYSGYIYGAPLITGSHTATIEAGNDPFYYTISETLPAGLKLSGLQTETLNGIPTVTGTYLLTQNAINASGTGSAPLTLVVEPSDIPIIISAPDVSGSQGLPFQYQIEATKNPVAFLAEGLPVGLQVDRTTGLISGVPIWSGSTTATIHTISESGMGQAPLAVSISPSSGIPPVFQDGMIFTGTVGREFPFTNIRTTHTGSLAAVNFPDGLTLQPYGGYIQGTPTLSGTFESHVVASCLWLRHGRVHFHYCGTGAKAHRRCAGYQCWLRLYIGNSRFEYILSCQCHERPDFI
jgi:hypothetical protein